MNTAVALIIFNRTDTTKKVLQALRQVKPAKLLVRDFQGIKSPNSIMIIIVTGGGGRRSSQRNTVRLRRLSVGASV
ncbi:MAG: hypothetical protein KME31_37095, partial [Tolypothrix carrinoi HA7290-LM1]|nr:hypothetical protein [Tolypothrix carrinoi HA7290-LM1]